MSRVVFKLMYSPGMLLHSNCFVLLAFLIEMILDQLQCWKQFIFLFLEAERFKHIYEEMADIGGKCSVVAAFSLSGPACSENE